MSLSTKQKLIANIIEQLQNELATAITASQEAHASATHSENVADNKYDTLGLEAAYLAHGQSIRILELQQTIKDYQRFTATASDINEPICLGTLVCIENLTGDIRKVFIGPGAGGLSVDNNQETIQIITPTAPLGKALLNKYLDDQIELPLGSTSQTLTVISIE